jgi:F-type H+-transporting ATPase subunit a
MIKKIYFIAIILGFYTSFGFAQADNHAKSDTTTMHTTVAPTAAEAHDNVYSTQAAEMHTQAEGSHAEGGEHAEGAHAYDPASTAIHHISDANTYSILDAFTIPLPMILKSDKGWDFFMSSKFHPGHHEDGHMAYNSYVMHHGSVHRITDESFPAGEQHIDSYAERTEQVDGKSVEAKYAIVGGKEYKLDARTTLDGGILGGGFTSFTDYSITKNVAAMLIVCLGLFFLLRAVVNRYRQHPDKAPKGVAAFIEPIFLFIRDEVAIPFIGKDKYKKYFPMLLSIFFFILGLNLFGQVPFLGSTNVTGNITVTMILAVLVFIIVNINGNKDYWKHVLWMPGVPKMVKPLLSIIEIASLFIKPLTLMLRLAGNISAGHVAILSFIGLIFVFGKSGESMAGAGVGTALAVPLTLFMMAIELLVAFLQAYVFTLLAASYIGAATEEHHHNEHH